MKTELIIIGDELLYGKTRDLNAFWLGPFLLERGLELQKVSIVHDNEADIQEALKLAFERVDIVFTSGGLGPTADDITKKTIGDFFKKELHESEEAKIIVKQNYARFNRPWLPEHNFYHHVPKDFTVVDNPAGHAPGFAYFEKGKAIFISPGVPREFQAMIEKSHFPLLQNHFKLDSPIKRITLRTFGVPEEVIFFELCPTLWKELEAWGKLSSLPLSHVGGVDIVLNVEAAKEKDALAFFKNQVENSKLAPYVWQWGELDLADYVVKIAKEKKKTFAFAESCSGGLCSSRITNIEGCSEVFMGAFICYSEEFKNDILQVSEETLKKHSVYSRECALEMAKGTQKKLNVDLAVALTGLAGPGGGSKENPVGTIYLAWADRQEAQSERYELRGDRLALKERFSQRALLTLLRRLERL